MNDVESQGKETERRRGADAPLRADARSDARRGVLDSLQPRRRLTGAEAAARSRFVAQMRVALPIVVVVLIGVFLASARKDAGDDPRLSDFKSADEVASTYELGGAKSAGVTTDGRPYTIEFDSATQSPSDANVAELVKPKATTVRKEGENSVVTADKGEFVQQNNYLKLEQNVRMTHEVAGEDYVIKAPAAEADVKDGVVTITTGVVGESATGGLRADRMKAYNADGRVVFEGNVSMRIYPKKRPAGATTTPPASPEAPQ